MAKEYMGRLEQENIILKRQLAEQIAKMQTDTVNALGGNVASEMKKIRQKGKASANTITVVEKHDHKNVSLWAKDGKRIGPMHPENAIQTLNRFADVGIMLTADQPTTEQIASYKQTTEYKVIEAKETKRRATKEKSRRTGQMEKLATEIAKMSGTTVEAINHILAAHEVKK